VEHLFKKTKPDNNRKLKIIFLPMVAISRNDKQAPNVQFIPENNPFESDLLTGDLEKIYVKKPHLITTISLIRDLADIKPISKIKADAADYFIFDRMKSTNSLTPKAVPPIPR